MRLLHISDTHGDRFWQKHSLAGIEGVVHTGDLLPNWTRGVRSIEVPYQEVWCRQNAPDVARWLGSRWWIQVQGNHDYVSFVTMLRELGIGAYDLSDGATVTTPRGIVFGGFPAVPTIAGEWNHEMSEGRISEQVARVLDRNVNVLLTHAPPMGILDGCAKPFGLDHIGSEAVHELLFSGRYPSVRYHLFGHCHEAGGMAKKVGDIRFFNAATKRHRIDIRC